ncbi:14823_t:CDS:2, partial [Racocetra fulgida]
MTFLCPKCVKERPFPTWCQECGVEYFEKNSENWTSGEPIIDKVIKYTQDNSKIPVDFVEWIPYEQFEKREKIGQDGFGSVYGAFWKSGPSLILKCFTASNFYTASTVYNPEISPIIRFYGLTKDAKGYLFVMQIAEHGDLQKYLFENFDKMKWFDDKLLILANIANGLRIIHQNGLTHRNLHCRNILIGDNGMAYITDFGPISSNKNSITQKLNCSAPFIAPETLKENTFTSKSDVYSFGFIMWMLSAGVIPYHYPSENTVLSQNIQEIIQEIELYIKRNTPKPPPPSKNFGNSSGQNDILRDVNEEKIKATYFCDADKEEYPTQISEGEPNQLPSKQTVDLSPVVTHPTIEITFRPCQEQQVKVQKVYVASEIEDSEENKYNDSYSINSLNNKETQPSTELITDIKGIDNTDEPNSLDTCDT